MILFKSGPSSEEVPAPAEFSAEAPPADPALEEHIAAGQPADVPPPSEEMPPNPEAATDDGAAAMAAPEPAPEAAPPIAAAPPAPVPVAEPIPAPSKPKADKKADAKAKATKKMAVVSAKTKTSNGLNRKKVLAHLQIQIDGRKSSWSDKLAKAKTMQAVMVVNKDGSVGKITTTPKSADTAKFLKEKFSGKPAAFKSKTGGKITLQLKTI